MAKSKSCKARIALAAVAASRVSDGRLAHNFRGLRGSLEAYGGYVHSVHSDVEFVDASAVSFSRF